RCGTPRAPGGPALQGVEAPRRDELTAAVSGLPLSATHAAWTAVLSGVDEVVRSCTYPTRQLTIITDLRKAGWDAEARAITRRWAESDSSIRVRVVDVGSDETGNVALGRLIPLDRAILGGADSRSAATLPNHTPRVLTG